jgi:putative oxidoreductase
MRITLLRPEPINTDVGILLVRLIFGGMFIYHGYTKLAAYSQIQPNFPDLIGIGATLSFNLVIFAEFGCGILVALGFLTRLAIIPIFITMSVAFFIAHAKDPFVVKQIAFVYWLLCVPIFVFGGGRYSVDRILFAP